MYGMLKQAPYGYNTQCGYCGLVDGRWMLFSTYDEYINYLRED